MKKKLRIGILFGGRSGEHEVSLLSAASILKAIDRKKYDVIPIGITKSGYCLATPPPRPLSSPEHLPRRSTSQHPRISRSLPPHPPPLE